jgi:hypothetical protein
VHYLAAVERGSDGAIADQGYNRIKFAAAFYVSNSKYLRFD